MQAPIVIAGATGFIGRALIAALGDAQPIIGLSRTAKTPLRGHRNVTWRACDLLHLRDAEQALAGARAAVYLVHSMLPQNSAMRGDFEDIDLLCADNFAQAAKFCGVRHIVYLTGIIPDEPNLSRHLKSRLEVEQTCQAYGMTSTTLRAGMIIGPGGSSFQLMSRLVKRLPVIVAPRWARSKSQAVALRDVVDALVFSLEHPKKAAGTWELGCPEVLSYREMMAQTAAVMGLKRRIVDVPLDTPALTLLGVGWLTGTPRELLTPLAESLRHKMVVGRKGLRLQAAAGIRPTPFKEAVRYALDHDPPAAVAKTRQKRPSKQTHVFVVKRLPMPPNTTALWAAQACASWLTSILNPLIQVELKQNHIYRFHVANNSKCLLELTYSPQQSSESRQVFRVSGGLLGRASGLHSTCFEFRAVLSNECLLMVIHDTSARHRWRTPQASRSAFYAGIMRLFDRHIRHLAQQPGH